MKKNTRKLLCNDFLKQFLQCEQKKVKQVSFILSYVLKRWSTIGFLWMLIIINAVPQSFSMDYASLLSPSMLTQTVPSVLPLGSLSLHEALAHLPEIPSSNMYAPKESIVQWKQGEEPNQKFIQGKITIEQCFHEYIEAFKQAGERYHIPEALTYIQKALFYAYMIGQASMLTEVYERLYITYYSYGKWLNMRGYQQEAQKAFIAAQQCIAQLKMYGKLGVESQEYGEWTKKRDCYEIFIAQEMNIAVAQMREMLERIKMQQGPSFTGHTLEIVINQATLWCCFKEGSIEHATRTELEAVKQQIDQKVAVFSPEDGPGRVILFETYVQVGKIASEKKEYALAQDCYEQATSLIPHHTELLLLRAETYCHLNDGRAWLMIKQACEAPVESSLKFVRRTHQMPSQTENLPSETSLLAHVVHELSTLGVRQQVANEDAQKQQQYLMFLQAPLDQEGQFGQILLPPQEFDDLLAVPFVHKFLFEDMRALRAQTAPQEKKEESAVSINFDNLVHMLQTHMFAAMVDYGKIPGDDNPLIQRQLNNRPRIVALISQYEGQRQLDRDRINKMSFLLHALPSYALQICMMAQDQAFAYPESLRILQNSMEKAIKKWCFSVEKALAQGDLSFAENQWKQEVRSSLDILKDPFAALAPQTGLLLGERAQVIVEQCISVAEKIAQLRTNRVLWDKGMDLFLRMRSCFESEFEILSKEGYYTDTSVSLEPMPGQSLQALDMFQNVLGNQPSAVGISSSGMKRTMEHMPLQSQSPRQSSSVQRDESFLFRDASLTRVGMSLFFRSMEFQKYCSPFARNVVQHFISAPTKRYPAGHFEIPRSFCQNRSTDELIACIDTLFACMLGYRASTAPAYQQIAGEILQGIEEILTMLQNRTDLTDQQRLMILYRKAVCSAGDISYKSTDYAKAAIEELLGQATILTRDVSLVPFYEYTGCMRGIMKLISVFEQCYPEDETLKTRCAQLKEDMLYRFFWSMKAMPSAEYINALSIDAGDAISDIFEEAIASGQSVLGEQMFAAGMEKFRQTPSASQAIGLEGVHMFYVMKNNTMRGRNCITSWGKDRPFNQERLERQIQRYMQAEEYIQQLMGRISSLPGDTLYYLLYTRIFHELNRANFEILKTDNRVTSTAMPYLEKTRECTQEFMRHFPEHITLYAYKTLGMVWGRTNHPGAMMLIFGNALRTIRLSFDGKGKGKKNDVYETAIREYFSALADEHYSLEMTTEMMREEIALARSWKYPLEELYRLAVGNLDTGRIARFMQLLLKDVSSDEIRMCAHAFGREIQNSALSSDEKEEIVTQVLTLAEDPALCPVARQMARSLHIPALIYRVELPGIIEKISSLEPQAPAKKKKKGAQEQNQSDVRHGRKTVLAIAQAFQAYSCDLTLLQKEEPLVQRQWLSLLETVATDSRVRTFASYDGQAHAEYAHWSALLGSAYAFCEACENGNAAWAQQWIGQARYETLCTEMTQLQPFATPEVFELIKHSASKERQIDEDKEEAAQRVSEIQALCKEYERLLDSAVLAKSYEQGTQSYEAIRDDLREKAQRALQSQYLFVPSEDVEQVVYTPSFSVAAARRQLDLLQTLCLQKMRSQNIGLEEHTYQRIITSLGQAHPEGNITGEMVSSECAKIIQAQQQEARYQEQVEILYQQCMSWIPQEQWTTLIQGHPMIDSLTQQALAIRREGIQQLYAPYAQLLDTAAVEAEYAQNSFSREEVQRGVKEKARVALQARYPFMTAREISPLVNGARFSLENVEAQLKEIQALRIARVRQSVSGITEEVYQGVLEELKKAHPAGAISEDMMKQACTIFVQQKQAQEETRYQEQVKEQQALYAAWMSPAEWATITQGHASPEAIAQKASQIRGAKIQQACARYEGLLQVKELADLYEQGQQPYAEIEHDLAEKALRAWQVQYPFIPVQELTSIINTHGFSIAEGKKQLAEWEQQYLRKIRIQCPNLQDIEYQAILSAVRKHHPEGTITEEMVKTQYTQFLEEKKQAEATYQQELKKLKTQYSSWITQEQWNGIIKGHAAIVAIQQQASRMRMRRLNTLCGAYEGLLDKNTLVQQYAQSTQSPEVIQDALQQRAIAVLKERYAEIASGDDIDQMCMGEESLKEVQQQLEGMYQQQVQDLCAVYSQWISAEEWAFMISGHPLITEIEARAIEQCPEELKDSIAALYEAVDIRWVDVQMCFLLIGLYPEDLGEEGTLDLSSISQQEFLSWYLHSIAGRSLAEEDTLFGVGVRIQPPEGATTTEQLVSLNMGGDEQLVLLGLASGNSVTLQDHTFGIITDMEMDEEESEPEEVQEKTQAAASMGRSV